MVKKHTANIDNNEPIAPSPNTTKWTKSMSVPLSGWGLVFASAEALETVFGLGAEGTPPTAPTVETSKTKQNIIPCILLPN